MTGPTRTRYRRHRADRRVHAVTLALAVVAGLAAVAAAPSGAAPADASPTVVVDGNSPGRTFDGIGAESAGAATALLKDYPTKQRSQILDYLFTPNYGESLQILKVEIGGDMNSTDGTEPSHQRTPTEVDCNRGYEWWLMEQAKKRNPNIKLLGLEWGAPGWVGNGANTVWTPQNVQYYLSWLGCARQHHLNIDYLGGWTERGFDKAWFESLRQALDTHGYANVQIVADDSFGWDQAAAMASDQNFSDAISVVGNHYPCGFPSGTSCPSTATAQSLNQPLWASEQTSYNGTPNFYDSSAARMAGEINRDYTDGKMTSTSIWPTVWSAYPGEAFPGGPILANTPWSGHYTIGTSLWAVAQTTQFAQPGWRYLDSGSSRLAGGGSVVTLRSPTSSAWSSIVETSDATAAQTLTYQLRNGMSVGLVKVWATDLTSSKAGDQFQRIATVHPNNGTFQFTAKPGYVYSLTTTTGQGKGKPSSRVPADTTMSLPYTDKFNEPAGTHPRYFTDLGGAFETARCDNAPGRCLQQQVTTKPVVWDDFDNYPLTIAGDQRWTDYRVTVDANVPTSGTVELDGRATPPGYADGLKGYHLRVDGTGKWSLVKEASTGSGPTSSVVDTALATGTNPSLAPYTWHRLGLSFRGATITASIDGRVVATVSDSTYQAGQIGLGASVLGKVQYRNLAIRPLSS